MAAHSLVNQPDTRPVTQVSDDGRADLGLSPA